jgi:beta-carotene hydroxylase
MGNVNSNRQLPPVRALGPGLLSIPRWRMGVSLALPFVLFAAFFFAASFDSWLAGLGIAAILSFVTYGSISHDLVHRTLGLSDRNNDAFLTAIELLMLRSGHAYRLAHMTHHANYPDSTNDPEGSAAHGTLTSALLAGPLYTPRLWRWAYRSYPSHRPRLLAEAIAVLSLVAAAILAGVVGELLSPVIYVILVYIGTWIVPVATAYIPHCPAGKSAPFQTRRFRGTLFRLLALDHLYHLEHHLYPAVPHQNWPALARRLDPYLDALEVPVFRLRVEARKP